MTDKEKIEKLKDSFEETIWMAIRYAHGRHTFAPNIVRRAIKNFQEVFPEWKLKPDMTLRIPEDVEKGSIESDYLNDLFKGGIL